MSKLRFGSAVSIAALASMLASCAAPQGRVTPIRNFGGTQGDVGLATRALAALNSGNVPTAITLAERAVAKTPNDAGFRALLGNAYFAGGRFWSAESALKDSLSLYANQPQVILKLALVEIALGKNNEALGFLETGRSVLDGADYGLALALAGHPADAVAVLQSVARQSGADARVRQNLALAYALGGDWTNARTIAAQDVPASRLDARIQQWMQLAKPAKAADQVAALVGVTPAQVDQGQPVRLALRKPDFRQAQAAPAPAPVQPVEGAQPAPAPQPVVAEMVPANASAPAPQPQFAEAVMPAPDTSQPAEAPAAPAAAESLAERPSVLSFAMAIADALPVFAPKKVAAKPAKVRKVAVRPQLKRGTSPVVVQLGAYRSPQYVTAAWNTLTKRYPALRNHLPMRARFDSPKGTFWRLSIQGFDSQREAIARCELLKSRGGSCFVRRFAGDTPVQYASR